MEGLTRALALDLAPTRVNAVAPGLIDTALWDTFGPQRAAILALGAALPVGRVGRPEEVAEGVLFLMCNGFVTGAVLSIDGGGSLVRRTRSSVRKAFVIVLFFLPMICGWVVLYKLSAYRRDGRGFGATFLNRNLRAYRRDFYTDEGQDLLRWAWFLAIITIPWCLGVGLLLG